MSHSQRVEGVFLHWRMLEASLRRKPLTCYETTNCAGLSRGNTSCRGNIFSLGSVFSPPGCRGIPPSTRSVNTRICLITASANEAPTYDQLETLLFFCRVHLELQFSRTRTNVCV